jgi:hypothetical protein
MSLELILANINKAQHSFVSSKSSAAEAAAHTYMVWLETMSSLASKENSTWIKAQIDDRNIEIKSHNAHEKSRRKQVKDYLAGKLIENDEESTGLAYLTKLTTMEWAARRKVYVDAKASANEFTTIVKFVLNFDRPSDASVTSRFATVLGWIHARFDGTEIRDASQIAEAIKAAGGFEVALIEQRNKDKSKEVEDDVKEREINGKAITEKAREAVQTSKAITCFDMRIKNIEKGIVLLIGRYANGQVEVVDDISVGSGEVESLLSHISDDLLPSASDNTDFIAHVLELGDLVAEGNATEKTHDGTVVGLKLVEQRTLTLLPYGKQNTELMISAIHADSSAVIKATPEPTRVDLGKAKTPMVMAGICFRNLEKMLNDRASRSLTEITANQEALSTDENSTQVSMSWVAKNSALIAESHPSGSRTFIWEDMTQQEGRPLDVDNFKPQFKVSVSAANIVALYRERLKIWHGQKKTHKLMTLAFRDDGMTYKIDGEESLETPCEGTIPVPVNLQFRPWCLHELLLKLTKQNTDKFEIAGDTGGLFCVSWRDHLGSYSVYMPTTNKNGRLETRRIAPMQVSPSSKLVAA